MTEKSSVVRPSGSEVHTGFRKPMICPCARPILFR